MGCGCSIRIAALLFIIILALVITGLLIGPIGSALFHVKAPSFLVVAKPQVKLPSEGIFHISSLFTITNTLIASWLTIIVLGSLFFAATRKMKLIPGGLQNFAEWIVEALLNFVTEIGRASCRERV